METETTQKKTSKKEKPEQPKKIGLVKKLDPAAAKLLFNLTEKANKKDYGRRVQEREIIQLALVQVTDEHIKEIQKTTLTGEDQVKIAHLEFLKTNPRVSLDQFLIRLVRGEINMKFKEVN